MVDAAKRMRDRGDFSISEDGADIARLVAD